MYNKNDDEMIISIPDLIAHLLLKWKTLLLGMIIGGILFTAYGVKKELDAQKAAQAAAEAELAAAIPVAGDMTSSVDMDVDELAESIKSYEEQIADAKDALTPFSISYVERLASQYRSYIEYKKKMLEYYLGYMLDTKELEEHLIKRIFYKVKSDTPGTDTFFTTQSILLTTEDYEKLLEVSPDEDALFDIYGRIKISAIKNETVQVLNMPDDEEGAISYMLNVAIISNDEGECNAMQAVLENALDRMQKKLTAADIQIEITPVTENFSEDVIDTIIGGQQGYVDNIVKLDNALVSFQNNYILKLTPEEKVYFDLIKEKQEAEGLLADGEELSTEEETDEEETGAEEGSDVETTPQNTSYLSMIKPKNTLLGMLVGLFLSCLIVVLQYLLNGTVKTRDELEDMYGLPMLTAICREDAKRNLFAGLAARIRKCKPGTAEADEVLLTHDLTNLIKKNTISSLYLALPAENDALKSEAETIRSLLSKKNDVQIRIGSPIYAAEELDAYSTSDAVLLFTKTHESRLQDIRKLLAVSSRYEKNILGYVAVEEC